MTDTDTNITVIFLETTEKECITGTSVPHSTRKFELCNTALTSQQQLSPVEHFNFRVLLGIIVSSR